MSWRDEMTTMLRYLINDVDETEYKYSDDRLATTILVAARLMFLNCDFAQTYSINVNAITLAPDPTDSATPDEPFVILTCLRAACIILGSEIKAESGNAISIKDGPSAIDLRGVTATLTTLYKDLSGKYDKLLLEYRAGNSIGGAAILGPYSPGSRGIYYDDHRNGGYFNTFGGNY